MTNETIRIVRRDGQDASELAGSVARRLGTRLATTMRWRGCLSPLYRSVGTADGRSIEIYEPDSAVTETQL